MKRKGVYVLIVAVFAFVGLTASSLNPMQSHTKFLNERAELLMREIGHQTLLYAGDSTSRVLPILRLSENVFQIPFEKNFSFLPDTLVRIVERSMIKSGVDLGYRVSVFDCTSKDMVYGFEMARPNSVVACLGRVQPSGCYTLQVSFIDPQPESTLDPIWVGLSLVSLLLIGFVWMRKSKEKQSEPLPVVSRPSMIQMGKFQFQPERRLLILDNEKSELSDKETRILLIFASRQNQPIDRDEIMKEVWENEGVIVGRSLDVFVSKLRKKLQNDPSVRIVNIHGKGYKLEVD